MSVQRIDTSSLTDQQRSILRDIILKKNKSRCQFAKDDLIAFSQLTLPGYRANWHHRLLANELQDVVAGKQKRLTVSMPPRHGKTELASIRFAPWYMGHNPTHKVAQATYSAEYAEENSKYSRDIVASHEFYDTFGFGLARDSKTVSKWKNDRGGRYYAVGVGGPLTGRGANLLIIDDPHKNRAEAESSVMRKNVLDWFKSTAYTRLEDGGAIVVIATRWHEGDLIGSLHTSDEKWNHVSLPAIAEQDEEFRKEGEPLWISKYDLPALINIQKAIGSREWTSLYQQRPSAAEGEIFKREYWRFYRELPVFEKIVHSWDTAFKKGSDNDYSVGTVWGVAANGYYLLYRFKDRVEFPELKRAVIMLNNQIPANEIIIEDKASGQSLIQELMRDTRLAIIPFKTDIDKIARANASTPPIECGRVFLPENAEWLLDYIDTMASFPKAIHDDDVDSTTQAILHMQKQSGYLYSSL